MLNNIILEGSISELEYTTKDDASVCVNGIIVSENLALYFYIKGSVAKEYHKKLFKNTKVLLKGKLTLLQWEDHDKNKRSRYSMEVNSIKVLNDEDKKFSIVYSVQNNNFSI